MSPDHRTDISGSVKDKMIGPRRWAGVIWRKIRFYCNGAIVKQLTKVPCHFGCQGRIQRRLIKENQCAKENIVPRTKKDRALMANTYKQRSKQDPRFGPAPACRSQQNLVQQRESLRPTAAAPIVAATPDATEQEQHQEDHQD